MNIQSGDLRHAGRLIRNTLENCTFFPSLTSKKEEILDALQQFETGYQEAERPLRILLAGGTGVGKSTLMNALAGKKIASASELRPTTTGFTAYIHQSDEDAWINSLHQLSIVKHERHALQGKLIIDAPDADSVVLQHRELLEKTMQMVDLIIVVSTPEKYVSRSVKQLLNRYKSGRRFAFVLNKSDNITDQSIQEDFKQTLRANGFDPDRIFILSARNAFFKKQQSDDDLATGDFNRLDQYIGETMNQVRIDEIKQLNLKERAALVADKLEANLPSNYDGIAEEWNTECLQTVDQTLNEFGTNVLSTMLKPEEIQSSLVLRKASGLNGAFGIVSDGIYFLRKSIRRQHSLMDYSETLKWIHQSFKKNNIINFSQHLSRIFRAWIMHAQQLDMNRDTIKNEISLAASQNDTDSIEEHLNNQMAVELQHELDQRGKPIGKPMSFILNLPGWAWIIYWIYRVIEPVFRNVQAPWNQLSGAAIALIFILVTEWMLFNKFIVWRCRYQSKKITSVVSAKITGDLKNHIIKIVRPVTSSIEKSTLQLDKAVRILRF